MMKAIKHFAYIIKLKLRAFRYFIRSIKTKNCIIQKGGRVLGNVNLQIDGHFNFGDNVIINGGGIDNVGFTQIQVSKDANLSIGNMSGISQTSICCKNSIRIGDYVNIGAGCMLLDSNCHSTYWKDHEDRYLDCRNAKSAPIIIGDYVFVGARSIIGKGVTIGDRAIICAGSVVVSNIPADCIAGGNPCKVINSINQ